MIDEKDKHILFVLDGNARTSYKYIASKVGLSKAAVMNRIKKMEKNKIILGYETIIDIMRLGYANYGIYMKFRNTTPEKEKEILDFFCAHKQTWVVVTGFGGVDICVLISTKSPTEYYEIWAEIYKEIKPYINVVRTTILVEYVHYTKNYLMPQIKVPKREIYVGKFGNYELDNVEKILLKNLSANARISVAELSEKVKLTPGAVIYRLRQLEKKQIIQGYRANINFKKLGYEYFKVIIGLNDLSNKDKIVSWLKEQINVVYYDGFIAGNDVEFDLEIESTDKFVEFLAKFKENFGTNINTLDYFNALQFHKSTYYVED